MAATSGGGGENEPNNGIADEDPDDLARRFPDLNEDERLVAARRALPDPPSKTFTRPAKAMRQGEPGADSGRWGRMRDDAGLNAKDLRGAGLAYTVGYQFVGTILAGAGVGWLADRYLLHSAGTPWGVIAGFLLGCVGGFYTLFRLTRQLNDDEERNRGGGMVGK